MKKTFCLVILSCLVLMYLTVPAAAGSLNLENNKDSIVKTLPYTGEEETESTTETATEEAEGGEAATEEEEAPNPLKDFGIIFAIAAGAGVVGFVAFKTARKKVKEES